MKKILNHILLSLLGVLLIISIYFFILGRQSQNGSPPGLVNGQLAACPSSPNCVNSEFRDDPEHLIEPLELATNRVDNTVIKSAIESMGGEIIDDQNNYLAATFSSKLFGFVDDVELRIDLTGQVLHFRSASRVGYSDLGANRKRIEQLKSVIDSSIQ